MKKEKIQPRKGPKQRRSRETVNCILTGTALLLEIKGLKGLSTIAIAQMAGVSVGSLYQYFPTKESILVTLIEEYFSWQDQQLLAYISQLDLSSDKELLVRSVVSKFYELITSQPQISRLLLQQAESLEVTSGLRAMDQDLVIKLHALFIQVLPQLKPSSVATLVAAIKGINDAYFRGDLHDISAQELVERVSKVAQVLLI